MNHGDARRCGDVYDGTAEPLVVPLHELCAASPSTHPVGSVTQYLVRMVAKYFIEPSQQKHNAPPPTASADAAPTHNGVATLLDVDGDICSKSANLVSSTECYIAHDSHADWTALRCAPTSLVTVLGVALQHILWCEQRVLIPLATLQAWYTATGDRGRLSDVWVEAKRLLYRRLLERFPEDALTRPIFDSGCEEGGMQPTERAISHLTSSVLACINLWLCDYDASGNCSDGGGGVVTSVARHHSLTSESVIRSCRGHVQRVLAKHMLPLLRCEEDVVDDGWARRLWHELRVRARTHLQELEVFLQQPVLVALASAVDCSRRTSNTSETNERDSTDPVSSLDHHATLFHAIWRSRAEEVAVACVLHSVRDVVAVSLRNEKRNRSSSDNCCTRETAVNSALCRLVGSLCDAVMPFQTPRGRGPWVASLNVTTILLGAFRQCWRRRPRAYDDSVPQQPPPARVAPPNPPPRHSTMRDEGLSSLPAFVVRARRGTVRGDFHQAHDSQRRRTQRSTPAAGARTSRCSVCKKRFSMRCIALHERTHCNEVREVAMREASMRETAVPSSCLGAPDEVPRDSSVTFTKVPLRRISKASVEALVEGHRTGEFADAQLCAAPRSSNTLGDAADATTTTATMVLSRVSIHAHWDGIAEHQQGAPTTDRSATLHVEGSDFLTTAYDDAALECDHSQWITVELESSAALKDDDRLDEYIIATM